MLVNSDRFLPGDIEVWERRARKDKIMSKSIRMEKLEQRAVSDILQWLQSGTAYVSMSFGKDSMVVAHLVSRVAPQLPICHVCMPSMQNPCNDDVRGAMRSCWGEKQIEYFDCDPIEPNPYEIDSCLKSAFLEMKKEFGDRYILGIRSGESKSREMRAMHGTVSARGRSCAPIIHWNSMDVFAYLEKYDLPIHPVYAMSLAGTMDRENIRVDHIGLLQGRGHGRLEWENTYFPERVKMAEYEV